MGLVPWSICVGLQYGKEFILLCKSCGKVIFCWKATRVGGWKEAYSRALHSQMLSPQLEGLRIPPRCYQKCLPVMPRCWGTGRLCTSSHVWDASQEAGHQWLLVTSWRLLRRLHTAFGLLAMALVNSIPANYIIHGTWYLGVGVLGTNSPQIPSVCCNSKFTVVVVTSSDYPGSFIPSCVVSFPHTSHLQEKHALGTTVPTFSPLSISILLLWSEIAKKNHNYEKGQRGKILTKRNRKIKLDSKHYLRNKSLCTVGLTSK